MVKEGILGGINNKDLVTKTANAEAPLNIRIYIYKRSLNIRVYTYKRSLNIRIYIHIKGISMELPDNETTVPLPDPTGYQIKRPKSAMAYDLLELNTS